VLRAAQVARIAEPQGAKAEFTAPQLATGEYQRLPAFLPSPPASLWLVQRRDYFRIGAPLSPPYFGVTTLPDPRTFRFRLFDLS
ncbi:flagellar regulator YcgR PilZN domain-containing protein, partial [Salmonella enterica]|uniref:flagellar regulator YcgR PilZN domain-containing protein n=1 Tax=Salmonella enterica TaxID=28901 RepID=UPI000AFDE3C2